MVASKQTEFEKVIQRSLQPLSVYVQQVRRKLPLYKSGVPEGISTGFVSLDRIFRLRGGEFIVIGARPSMGKSVLMMQFAEAMAYNASEIEIVPIFSAEMTGMQLALRMACAKANVDSNDIRNGTANDQMYEEFERALVALEELAIYIDESSAPSTTHMRDQLMTLLEVGFFPRGMVFDYVEMAGDKGERGRELSSEQKVSMIALALKEIAKALNIPVVAAAQLHREVETRATKLPQLSDFRMSGMIEQAADIALTLLRPSYYIDRGLSVACELESDRENVAYVGVLKNRNGAAGMWVRMSFQPAVTRFGDIAIVSERVDSFPIFDPTK